MFFNRPRRPAPPRPVARLSVEPLDERIVPARLSVADATIVEGNTGTRYAQVAVRLDAPGGRTVTVNYATAGGSATAGSDFTAVSGQLTFAPGQTVKTVLVPVHGDRVAEPNETVAVVLSGARHASIRDGTGVVTITDDEPRLSVGDAWGTVVSHLDGVSGTTLHFTVSLAMAYDQAVTVNYATADGTATAGVDYLAAAGTLTFAPGETTKTIAVTTTANFAFGTLQFSIKLTGASANAQILDDQGVGSIYYHVEQPGGGGGGGCDPDGPYFCP
jgi:chitinase